MIKFQFEGTSHGRGYGGMIDGLPNGFVVDVEDVNRWLSLRKSGYGRSERQTLADIVELESDVVSDGRLRFFVSNAHMENRKEITALRSGHADVVAPARYGISARQAAELASARNSIGYVVLGAVCKQLLAKANIFTYSYVENIGGIASRNRYKFGVTEKSEHFPLFRCPCRYATGKIKDAVDAARASGNSLGGIAAVGATGVPMGIGGIFPYHRRLDAVISANVMGIPSVKGIEFGAGQKLAAMTGVEAHDKLFVKDGKVEYAENKCGGIVAGVTTGQDIFFRLTVKPVPTVAGVETVDVQTLETVPQHCERADTCVVPNVGVIAENILAYVLVDEILTQKSDFFDNV